MDVKIIELKNGIRVMYRAVPTTRLAFCGIVVDVGGRDETPEQCGMAHFIEHMVFKGTRKRKAFHILSHIDSVGGELNAFTTKEKTTVHATVTKEHVGRAFDLLGDIALHSNFPAAEIEKEKTVIAEEIDMYRDDPEEAVFEDFDALVYPAHPLGRPIVGYKDTLRNFSQQKLKTYVGAGWQPRNMIFSVVGNVTEAEVTRLAQKYFGQAAMRARGHKLARRTTPRASAPILRVVERPIHQSHVIIGGPAPALRAEGYFAFMLLQNHLGGPGMNSRLNLNIRERYGLTYNIQSFVQPYTDGGIWGVYAAMEPALRSRVIKLAEKELRYFCTTLVGTAALAKMKKQAIGQIVIANESLFAQMISQAKDTLDFGRPILIDEIIRSLEAVTPQQIREVANRYMHPKNLHRLTYVPKV
jgi:predicted Zn-dependent peptidase